MRYNKAMRLFVIGIIVVIMFSLCLVRLINLQIINGSNLRKVSEDKLYMSMSVKAPRGNILDRYGNVLATNKQGYSIRIQKTDMSREELSEVIKNLMKLLAKENIVINDQFPVSKEEPFGFTFKDDDEKTAVAKLYEWEEEYGIEKTKDVKEVINAFCDKYDIDSKYDYNMKRKVVGIMYDMNQRGFSIYNPYILAEDVSAQVIAIVKENSSVLEGVTIVETPIRVYPNGTLAAHLLGNVGVIYQDEYEKLKNKNYSMDAIIGKQGIELAMEDYLKGEDGIQGFNQTLEVLSDVVTTVNPVQGDNVFLTIDADLQKVMEDELSSVITNLSKSVPDCNAGSAVCVDVNNGEILAMCSYPTYPPSEYNKKYNELIADEGNPVWNRAIGGAYEPGSTFKMVTAIAAIEEGIIGPYDTILDKGVYKYYKDYQPQCMEWKYGKTHGYVDVVTALQESCNYYFFDVGRRLGIDKLTEYEKKFGFGQIADIEIGGEVAGTIASPENRKKRGMIWNPGDTLQASIGQSDNLITPLQLANYVATIANGGTRYQPHLVKTVKKHQTGEIILDKKSEIVEKVDISEKTLSAVKKGMNKVTQEGTASSVFKDFFIDIAGKTGTAEVNKGSNTGVFVAFAPYDNPKIAIAIVIEHGTAGYLAAPVAKAVFEEYFSGDGISDYYSVKQLNK